MTLQDVCDAVHRELTPYGLSFGWIYAEAFEQGVRSTVPTIENDRREVGPTREDDHYKQTRAILRAAPKEELQELRHDNPAYFHTGPELHTETEHAATFAENCGLSSIPLQGTLIHFTHPDLLLLADAELVAACGAWLFFERHERFSRRLVDEKLRQFTYLALRDSGLKKVKASMDVAAKETTRAKQFEDTVKSTLR